MFIYLYLYTYMYIYVNILFIIHLYICDKLTTSSSNNIINLPTKINSQIVQSKTALYHVGGKAMIKHGTNIVYGE